MDPISHAVFGATITQAIRWKKYWNRATIFGGLVAMIPDIDIVVQYIPWLNPLWASFFHRTMTHSLLFVLCLAPILARLMRYLFSKRPIPRRSLALMGVVTLSSHIFLDLCTTYGIWLFWPFIDYGYELNIISVVDVFFSIPLWLLLLVWMWINYRKKNKKKHDRIRYLGVIYATSYLVMMGYTQQSLKASMRDDMQMAGIKYERVFASPQLLQPFLWYGIVELFDGSYKVLHTSVFDKKPRIYQNVYWYHSENAYQSRQNKRVAELEARSHGRYVYEKVWSETYFIDIRFPKTLWWSTSKVQPSPFVYKLNQQDIPTQVAQWFSLPVSDIWQEYRWKVRGRN